MGADNWAVCPKCREIRLSKAKSKRDSAAASYGIISATAYASLFNEAQALDDEEPEETLREDYQVGIDSGGDFFCHYDASCGRCGYKFSYWHDEQTKIKAN